MIRGSLSSVWKTLHIGSPYDHEKARTRIEKWFYSEKQSDARKGDVAMSDFSFVRIFRMPESTLQVDLCHIDPFECAYVLFVEYIEVVGKLDILGGYTFQELFEKNGFVVRDHLKQCRAFQPCYEPEDVHEMVMEEENEEVDELFSADSEKEEEQQDGDNTNASLIPFYFPFAVPIQESILAKSKFDWHLLENKMQWIANCAKSSSKEQLFRSWTKGNNGCAPMLMNDPVVDYHASLFLPIVIHYCFLTEYRQLENGDSGVAKVDFDRFEAARMYAERAVFEYRMKKWCESDADILELFRYNGMDNTLRTSIVKGRPVDNFFYWKRFPKKRHLGPPQMFFAIPMEELPADVVSEFPLYVNGTVLLSRHDIVEWIWNKIAAEKKQVFTSSYMKHPAYADQPEILHRIGQYLKPFYEDILKQIPAKRVRQLEEATFTPDIEDLVSWMLPLCMRNLVNKSGPNAFPKDGERVPLVRVLRRAGISEDTTGALLNKVDKLERGDSTTLDDTIARYNFKHTHGAGYSSVYCDRLVAVAMENKQNARVAKCPIVYKRMERARIAFKAAHPDSSVQQWMGLAEEEKLKWVKVAGDDESLPKEQRKVNTIRSCQQVCFEITKQRIGHARIIPNDFNYLSPSKIVRWAQRKK